MIYLEEYHSRYAKALCLFLAIVISGMFYLKSIDSKSVSGDSESYYEGAKNNLNNIFNPEIRIRRAWAFYEPSLSRRYESYEEYEKDQLNTFWKENLSSYIISLLLVYMVIPYFLMGYLFTAVFHPIVLDPKRKIIYTVKRGKVYLFKRSDVSNREYPFFDEKGAVISCDHGKGVSVRLKSIDRDKYRTFKMGVFPPFKDMQIYYLDKIFTALDYSDESSRKHYAHTDYFRYLRWITTVSLYPSFLCKKVDDPHYLAQIDQYLAKREKWKHIKK